MFVERYAYDETMHTQGSNSSLSQGASFVKGLGAGVAIGMGKDGESKGIIEGEYGGGGGMGLGGGGHSLFQGRYPKFHTPVYATTALSHFSCWFIAPVLKGQYITVTTDDLQQASFIYLLL